MQTQSQIELEDNLLNTPEKLYSMNNLLFEHQFSENFLTKTIYYYDSWKCLRSQKNLSPYFCFRYLYDSQYDSVDNWTDYNDVESYLKKLNYNEEEITEAFDNAMNDRIDRIMIKPADLNY
jgi:hypothetical protein